MEKACILGQPEFQSFAVEGAKHEGFVSFTRFMFFVSSDLFMTCSICPLAWRPLPAVVVICPSYGFHVLCVYFQALSFDAC